MLEKHSLTCQLSKDTNFEELFNIKKFPIYMGTIKKNFNVKLMNLKFHINKKTGTVQIFPRVPLKKLYFKSHNSGKIGNIWKDHHTQFNNLIKKYLHGTIVEIGGGHNSITSIPIESSKIKIYSFDPNINKNKNRNIIKINSFISEKEMKKNCIPKVDLFIHSHLLEHIYDPLNFLNLIKKNIKNDGMHIFSVPNMKVMIKKKYVNAMNFEHPYYLEENIIDKLLALAGFKIIKKFYFRNDHSIFYLTKKKKINKTKKIKFKNGYIKNKKLFLNLYNYWIKDVKQINKKIKNLDNNSVFMFGAHIFSQSLLCLGLDYQKIKCILDNDKDKQNEILYGTNFQVKSPKILKNFKNPTVILRANAYNAEIIKDIHSINKNCNII